MALTVARTGSLPIERLSPAPASPRLLEVAQVARRLSVGEEFVGGC
jgi:hypothetical protein